MKQLIRNITLALMLIGGTYAIGITSLCMAANNTNCDRTTVSTQIIENLLRR